jgi:hypothetical protein
MIVSQHAGDTSMNVRREPGGVTDNYRRLLVYHRMMSVTRKRRCAAQPYLPANAAVSVQIAVVSVQRNSRPLTTTQ